MFRNREIDEFAKILNKVWDKHIALKNSVNEIEKECSDLFEQHLKRIEALENSTKEYDFSTSSLNERLDLVNRLYNAYSKTYDEQNKQREIITELQKGIIDLKGLISQLSNQTVTLNKVIENMKNEYRPLLALNRKLSRIDEYRDSGWKLTKADKFIFTYQRIIDQKKETVEIPSAVHDSIVANSFKVDSIETTALSLNETIYSVGETRIPASLVGFIRKEELDVVIAKKTVDSPHQPEMDDTQSRIPIKNNQKPRNADKNLNDSKNDYEEDGEIDETDDEDEEDDDE